MNAVVEPGWHNMTALTQDIDLACARIAPTWPLDQFNAVNPYWGWVDQPMPQAAAALDQPVHP